jgi:hypothetical protein
MEKTMGFPAVTLAVMLGMLLCSRAEAQQVKHVGVLYTRSSNSDRPFDIALEMKDKYANHRRS